MINQHLKTALRRVVAETTYYHRINDPEPVELGRLKKTGKKWTAFDEGKVDAPFWITPSYELETSSWLIQSVLVEKYREEKDRKEWALLSKNRKKVLYWFGLKKPSKESVDKQERRVQYWKSQSSQIEAAMKNLTNEALYKGQSTIILYDPKVKTILEDWEKAGKYILGIVELRDNESFDTWEISSIWAKKGYGPLMYLLAMQETGNEGLMPNRLGGQVTPEAKRVWKGFYDGQGKDLVRYEDTDADHHDEDYLNKKYFIEKPFNTNTAKQRHKQVIGRDPYDERLTTLIEIADQFIRGEMEEIYGDK